VFTALRFFIHDEKLDTGYKHTGMTDAGLMRAGKTIVN
jgi:hypothetical protein